MQERMDGFVIPANAGIQATVASESRVKPRMTGGIAPIAFNLRLY
jgi:hypothetical protein